MQDFQRSVYQAGSSFKSMQELQRFSLSFSETVQMLMQPSKEIKGRLYSIAKSFLEHTQLQVARRC